MLKLKERIKQFTMVLATAAVILLPASPTYAQGLFGGGGGGNNSAGSECGGTQTQLVSCDSEAGVAAINDLISIALLVLTVIIGVVAVGALAYAGIIYASSKDNQSQVDEAKTLIRNVVVGLLFYVFTIAIINWLVPGGVIG